MTTLERGFKSWAERTAAGLRDDLSLSSEDSLEPRQLAAYLQVELRTPDDIDGLPDATKRQLLVIDPSGWSAVTIERGKATLIIYNPTHSVGRQASDITHELAHLILGHKPSTLIISNDGHLIMRSYDQKQEDEANWLAWALLLPRETLLYCKRIQLGTAQIAQRFGVSEKLVNYRLRITGVEAQLRRAARFGRR
jgi:IrrE N-terminal-like domain